MNTPEIIVCSGFLAFNIGLLTVIYNISGKKSVKYYLELQDVKRSLRICQQEYDDLSGRMSAHRQYIREHIKDPNQAINILNALYVLSQESSDFDFGKALKDFKCSRIKNALKRKQ